MNQKETGFHRLDNELTKSNPFDEAIKIGQQSIEAHEKKKAIEPIHYKNDYKGKYIDKFDQWYHEHPINEFRAIMRAIAERYITRYEHKNGVIDLEKGIYTLERLKEYEEREDSADI